MRGWQVGRGYEGGGVGGCEVVEVARLSVGGVQEWWVLGGGYEMAEGLKWWGGRCEGGGPWGGCEGGGSEKHVRVVSSDQTLGWCVSELRN